MLKGLAVGTTGGHSYLYSADFHNGVIQVTKGDAAAPNLLGTFIDPTLPAEFSPFNIQNLNDTLYVTYAIPDAAGHDDVPGAGHGVVDAFDLNGNFLRRIATGGALDSPWGLALAPAGFGTLSGQLLVGNFGNGMINAFDPLGGGQIGTLADMNGNDIVNKGLWGLKFGNGGNGGRPDALYITVGVNAEADGLFARIGLVPEPGTVGLLLLGAVSLGLARRLNVLRNRH